VRALALVVLLCSAGCLSPDVVTCPDGRTCPAGLACDDDHGRCLLAEQLERCRGHADRDPCTIRGEDVGICSDQICLVEGCGDGLVTGTEECDGDVMPETSCDQIGFYQPGALGCTARCSYETSACGSSCGDHVTAYVKWYVQSSTFDGVGENWLDAAYDDNGGDDQLSHAHGVSTETLARKPFGDR